MNPPNLNTSSGRLKTLLILSVLSLLLFPKQSYARPDNPIQIHTLNPTDTISGMPSYSISRNTFFNPPEPPWFAYTWHDDDYNTNNGQPSTDAWHEFSTTDTLDLKITVSGDFDTYVHLLDANFNEIASNDNSLVENESYIEYSGLLPGESYYIVVEGNGTASGNYSLFVYAFGEPDIPPAGANMSNAIDAGSFSLSGSYSDTRSNAEVGLGDDFGYSSKDIYYQFTLSGPAQVTLSHCGSNFDTALYLLDASGNFIALSNNNYSSPCSGEEAYLETPLAAGTYYVVSEGYMSLTGNIVTSIEVSITGGLQTNCAALASSLSQNQNYIVTYSPRAPFTTTASLADKNVCQVNQTVQYFDGLGRPLQTVQTKASADATKDIVQPIAYDAYGREASKYLPYASSSNDGSYKTDALSPGAGVFSFYNPSGSSGSQLANGIARIPTPFAETLFELSPLNRVAQQGAPGDAWQLTSGHTVKQFYETNISGEVNRWDVSGTGAYINGSYAAGTLYKTRTQDENGYETIEFKDLEGRLILKKIQDGASGYSSTYYVYDDLGNLSFVIPPKVSVTTFNENTAEFATLIYGYRYDGRQRLIKKKIPGKGWESMVYNVLDQVVATQDALQAAANLYAFNKYDAHGRIIMTGEVTDARIPETLQNDIKSQAVNWETPDNNYIEGYTQSSYPSSWNKLFTINYYDNYTYPGNPYTPTTATGITTRTKGLLTASQVRNLETGSMLWTVNYYNEEGRLRESIVQNHIGGTDLIINDYEFTGEIKTSTRTHSSTSVPSLVIRNGYIYDHMGRKIQSWQQTGSGTAVILSQLHYNETGQLYQKKLHSEDGTNFIEPITYLYNPRGWLAQISSDKLTENLYYETAPFSGVTPNYNGNITEAWYVTPNRGDRRFYYKYDGANRLKESRYHTAASHTGELDEVISYDKMGNIENLARGNAGLSFTHSGAFAYDYTASGNRLNWVTNNGNAYRSYSYDANGNVTADGALGFEYNELNLPRYVKQNNVPLITYTYTATGQKLKKSSGQSGVSDYVSGIHYSNNGATIDFIQTEEGRYEYSSGKYQYNLMDHLGNVRVMIDKNTATTSTAVQENEYYAFGLNVNRTNVSPENKYLYNSKELQEELGAYDYGARFYDPVIGRWTTIDPSAENDASYSPYIYAFNNPVRFTDPDGRWPWDSPANKNPNKETTYTAVLTLGAQVAVDVELLGVKVGFEINAASFDVIGVRENNFVFMEGKRQGVGLSVGIVGAKAERTFVDKPAGEDKVRTTKTTNTEVSYATRSLGKEKVEKSTTDYKTGQTKSKTVSEKTVAKESWGIKAAGLIGFDFSRDVVVKGPEQVKKDPKKNYYE